jgi:hypothetical protein
MQEERFQDRFPIVEAYLQEAFLDAKVSRLPRREWAGQLWRAETSERDYDLGMTDEALEESPSERLAHDLRYNPIRKYLVECSPSERLWMFSAGVLTKAKLGESPSP